VKGGRVADWLVILTPMIIKTSRRARPAILTACGSKENISRDGMDSIGGSVQIRVTMLSKHRKLYSSKGTSSDRKDGMIGYPST
jgi:hypothetical protein